MKYQRLKNISIQKGVIWLSSYVNAAMNEEDLDKYNKRDYDGSVDNSSLAAM